MQGFHLREADTTSLARLALACIDTEFPNKLDHVLDGPGALRTPRALHPAFYGCFDWHSAVHGHWLLVRLLRLWPDFHLAPQIRTALGMHLTAENLRAEAAYLAAPEHAAFERPYGWAWLLHLAAELRACTDPAGQSWARHLQPLAAGVVARYRAYFPQQTYAIRAGTHPNTAFALAFALDYAQSCALPEFASLLRERSRSYFGADADGPAGWEPGGTDFLSPCLVEADLMRRVLPPAEFGAWLARFLPGLPHGEPASLFQPATVSERTDGQLGHLDGLNLSRAWCLRGIAAALPPASPAYHVLLESASRHAQAALPHVVSGNYAGEHWLGTFALYLLSTGALPPAAAAAALPE